MSINILSGEPARAYREYLEAGERVSRVTDAYRALNGKDIKDGSFALPMVIISILPLSFLYLLGNPYLGTAGVLLPVITYVLVVTLHPKVLFNKRKHRERLGETIEEAIDAQKQAFRDYCRAIQSAVSVRPELEYKQDLGWNEQPTNIRVRDTENKVTYNLRVADGVPFLVSKDGDLLVHNYESSQRTGFHDDSGRLVVLDKNALDIVRATTID